MSYGLITQTLNAEFKDEPRKTRNSTIGRAKRAGYSVNKPSDGRGVRNPGGRPRKSNGKPNMIDAAKAHRIMTTADARESMLREEGDPGVSRRRGRKLSEGTPALEERRKGYLPAIVEQAPMTSVALVELDRGACMWPTNEAATEVCGEPAKVGAYCSRHAQVAFRVMPTRKRNRVRDKEDREYLVRVDGSHLRGESDADGEWLSRQLMAMDEITVSSEDDGIAPLALPFFLEKLA